MTNEPQRVATEIFQRLHQGLQQQGAGSDASTLRALELVPGLPEAPTILDLGCGSGRQTLALARATGGHVTAVDLAPEFLDEVDERARKAELGARIETFQGSMSNLPYAPESFDLIWCEGAIYNIGFSRGLRNWGQFLRPGGAMAVSELLWLSDTPPERVFRFWKAGYPDMRNLEANESAVSQAGFELLGTFILPESDWWGDYYTPIEKRIEALRKEHGDDEWKTALDSHQKEIDIFRAREGSFGYGFFVMQKPSAAR